MGPSTNLAPPAFPPRGSGEAQPPPRPRPPAPPPPSDPLPESPPTAGCSPGRVRRGRRRWPARPARLAVYRARLPAGAAGRGPALRPRPRPRRRDGGRAADRDRDERAARRPGGGGPGGPAAAPAGQPGRGGPGPPAPAAGGPTAAGRRPAEGLAGAGARRVPRPRVGEGLLRGDEGRGAHGLSLLQGELALQGAPPPSSRAAVSEALLAPSARLVLWRAGHGQTSAEPGSSAY